jgi:hypothetical protein
MISIFYDYFSENAHKEFQQWRDKNPRGFFLNVKSKSYGMIHQSTCTHPGGTDNDDVSLTKRMKVGADTQMELKEYGKHYDMVIDPCSDCIK